MSHAEAEGSEEKPAVLLLVDHQVQGRPHARYTPVLVEDRLAGAGVRGHIRVGIVSGGDLSQEVERPALS